MIWDPFGSLKSPAKQWLWGTLALAAVLMQGPSFVASFWPDPLRGADFFQDWASARNHFEGLDVYTSHTVTIPRYLGHANAKIYLDFNAHPPTNVLLCLPFGLLPFPQAAVAWNVLSFCMLITSLILLIRGLELPWNLWAVCPSVTLILLSNPIRLEFVQGQFNSILLVLLTGVWLLSRRGHDILSGILLGIAVGVKLYPAFLVFYFLLMRRWRLVVTAAASAAMAGAAAYHVLGSETIQHYWFEILPQMRRYQGSAINLSVQGFWAKLFAPEVGRGHQLTPFWLSPATARALGTLSALGVAAIFGVRVLRNVRLGRHHQDHGFGLAVIAMLLTSPITWDHYLTLLILPFAFLWLEVGDCQWRRVAFVASVAFAMAPPYIAFIPYSQVIDPLMTVTASSLQTYLLVGLFCWELTLSRTASDAPAAEPGMV